MQNTINAITELLTEYTSHSWKCLHGITSHNQTEEELQKIVDSQLLCYKERRNCLKTMPVCILNFPLCFEYLRKNAEYMGPPSQGRES